MIECDVAIVLVNYNSSEDTLDCLESIEKQVSIKYQVVIVDNHSEDFEILDSFTKKKDDITLIRNEENVGFARANNIGIDYIRRHISYDFLFLLNNDTILAKGAVDKLISPFSDDSKIGVTTSRIMYEHERDVVWYGGGEINYIRGKPLITDYNRPASEKGALQSKFVTFISGCVMMFSKKCIDDLKGFDKRFFMYCEDLELCIRANKKGYKLWYESNSVIYHKVQGSTKSDEKAITGIHPLNPNSYFLFDHIKKNIWLTNTIHQSGFKLFLFKIIFFLEIHFIVVKFIGYGKSKILIHYKKLIKYIFFEKKF